MIQMDEFGLVFREFGRETLPGFRRVCEVIWCFVVRISHIGSTSAGEGDEEFEAFRRSFFLEINAA